jgi:DNA-directed RNA polymerase specialized sigma24 family protein
MYDKKARDEGHHMAAGRSVAEWIDQLKQGDQQAVQQLWERCFTRLVRLTARWLRRRAATHSARAEDVAADALATFLRRAAEDSFPRLCDRNDLWHLLVVIAFRKTCKQVLDEARRQPPGGPV